MRKFPPTASPDTYIISYPHNPDQHVLSQEVCPDDKRSRLTIFERNLTTTDSSWLPLLFIPTNASPLFIISFVTVTYILHRPCIYCSALLLILFLSSCHWSDHCFFDFRGDWFSPRFASSPVTYTVPSNASIAADKVEFGNESFARYVIEAVNTTTKALAGAALEEARKGFTNGTVETRQEEWTGMGLEWLRSLLGRREWTLPCVDVKVRL